MGKDDKSGAELARKLQNQEMVRECLSWEEKSQAAQRNLEDAKARLGRSDPKEAAKAKDAYDRAFRECENAHRNYVHWHKKIR